MAEVAETDDAKADSAPEEMPDIIGTRDIERLLQVVSGTLNQWRVRKLFPQPGGKIGKNPWWTRAVVCAWAEDTGRAPWATIERDIRGQKKGGRKKLYPDRKPRAKPPIARPLIKGLERPAACINCGVDYASDDGKVWQQAANGDLRHQPPCPTTYEDEVEADPDWL